MNGEGRAEFTAARNAGLTARHRRRLAAMTERDLQQTVIDASRALRLLCYHTRDSRGSIAGFPDLVIVGPGGIVFVELKTASGRLTGAQSIWLQAINAAGVHAHVWRPEQLLNGTITATLRQLAKAKAKGQPS